MVSSKGRIYGGITLDLELEMELEAKLLCLVNNILYFLIWLIVVWCLWNARNKIVSQVLTWGWFINRMGEIRMCNFMISGITPPLGQSESLNLD